MLRANSYEYYMIYIKITSAKIATYLSIEITNSIQVSDTRDLPNVF